MQKHLADLVYPVVTYGLQLQERLDQGAMPDIDAEQAILKDLLLTDYESQRWVEFGGEVARERGKLSEPIPGGVRPSVTQTFLGVRYALVCWLDELFTCDTEWGTRWNERKLEVELYGSNDRAWKFWQQARLAQGRQGHCSLEGYYLCVMLGFRGEMRDHPEQLQTWITNAKFRLGNVQEPQWPFASPLDPPTCVPPLHGREGLERMAMASWLALLAAIPIVAFLLVQRLGN